MKKNIEIILLFMGIIFAQDSFKLSQRDFLDNPNGKQFERGRYLIILGGASLESSLSDVGGDFIEFKKSQGYDIEIVYLDQIELLPENTSVDNIFSGVTSNLLAVANGTSAALYDYPDWSGGLTNIDQTEGYWVVMSGDDEISISEGTPLDPSTAYSLDAGASLIGYPLNTNTAFETALGAEAVLGNIYAVFGEGISAYNYNGLWIGSLQYFTPNSGYWFLSNNAINFDYDTEDNLSRQYSEYIEVPKNPDGYEYYQSKRQSFYYVENVEDIQINDWVLAYNGDILVGARQYIGGIIDIPVMGYDNTDFTAGYCDNGDVPEFKLFRSSTGMLNELSGNVTEWVSNTVTVLDNLSLTLKLLEKNSSIS